jgi:hypothetical protein
MVQGHRRARKHHGKEGPRTGDLQRQGLVLNLNSNINPIIIKPDCPTLVLLVHERRISDGPAAHFPNRRTKDGIHFLTFGHSRPDFETGALVFCALDD